MPSLLNLESVILESIILLFIWFQVKHFVFDFPLQLPYMYLNKGKYMHPGGLLHALLHGIGTFLILLLVLRNSQIGFWISVGLAYADFVIHYHIDWAKMRINVKYNWLPNNSPYFWILLGFDQFLHQITYLGIIYLCVKT